MHRRGRAKGFDGLHRPQQAQQCADIVDTHIVGQGAAVAPQEGEHLSVQRLIAVDDRQAGGNFADHVGIQRAAGGLDARAQHGVRGHAQIQPFAVRQRAKLLGFRNGDRHHLFRPYMLARFQHLPDDAVMRIGRGQVDHQLDVGGGGYLVDGHHPLNAIGFGFFLRRRPVNIRCGPEINDGKQVFQVFDVDVADHAAAHHGGSDFFHGSFLLLSIEINHTVRRFLFYSIK